LVADQTRQRHVQQGLAVPVADPVEMAESWMEVQVSQAWSLAWRSSQQMAGEEA
jgi:hypothetical protein